MAEYEWMNHVEQWQQYFPCVDDNSDDDELTPPVEDHDLEEKLEFDNIFAFFDIEPETPQPLLPSITTTAAPAIPDKTLLQNIHLFQPQLRYTYPVDTLPNFKF